MTELEQLLKELGLEQYAEIFAENDIDFEILPELSEADFEKLGLSLGHRRKLMRAIAASRPGATEKKAEIAPTVSQEAERRQVTVLFSDLVGSTALANELDPEDMSALLKRYQDLCAGAISRFGGSIAKFLGDGVLAYFGYPQAHEDAPERAVYAALAILDGLAEIPGPTGESIQSRIGIATGLVVIGDIIESGMAREHSIVGETPNLAARLQAAAEPNTILVSQTTHRLLGRQFDFENLGERTLKGFSNPVPVWRVLREAAVSSRFAAGRAGKAGRFVGRIQEVDLLLDRWQSSKNGEGQAVVISGEAGMGKSRLVDAFCDRVSNDPYYLLICQCSPYHTNSPLHPVIRQLERSAGFDADDSSATKLEKLEELLSATDNLNDTTRSLFAELLSIPLGDRYPALDLGPPQRKAATIAAIIHQLARLADQKPVLFVLEDVHWIDPTTQDLVTRLMDSITATRVLLLITARAEFLSPWTGRDYVTALTLSRLSKPQCAELVTGVARDHALEQAVIDDIVTKTDGVPLFIEELTKTVMESASPDRSSVPSTLRDSLMARLDRLGPAKEIAQIAAVIGQQFSYALLERVSPASSSDTENGIARLLEAGLAYAQGRATEPSYTFKHALMRDVAYDNLLKTRRQQLHGKVARELEENFQAVTQTEPELVAYHFAQAGIADSASSYYERAGDRATAHSNFAEAVAHFGGALQQTGLAAENNERSPRELALLLKLGPALAIIKGLQSPAAKEIYQQAQAIAQSLGDENATFKATWGLWLSDNVGRNLAEALRLADELVEIAQQAADSDLLLEALHCRWSTAYFRGDTITALADSRKGVESYDPARHHWMAAVYGGHDPGVCAHAVQSNASTLLGRLNDAKKHIEKTISLGETLKHPHSLAHAFQNATISSQIISDYEGVEDFAQKLLDLAEKYNFPPQGAHARLLAGWARAVGHNSKADLEVVEAEYPRAIMIAPLFRYYAALLAEAQLKFGRASDALTILNSAIETVTEPGVGFCLPELYRLKGLCLLELGARNREEAMASLHTAIDTAKQQKAPVYELKAAIDLAEMASSLGQPETGMAALRDAWAKLPKEFNAPQLAKAKEMLSQ